MSERANLRAMFAPGAPSHLLARDVFTDRVGERRAFQASIASMADRLDRIDATDLSTPRTNVLYFYGIGGVGKSRLLAELERLAAAPGQLGNSTRIVTARVDMGVGGLDIERLLLQMRADFGTALRRAQAFDLVAASYWERAHAGESISQFFRRDSVLKRHAEKSGVADHVKIAIEEVTVAAVGTSVVASVGTTSARLLRDSIRSSQQYRQLTSRLPWFEHLLAADPTVENFSYLAALLAWDISEEQQRSLLLPIVFVDTVEHVVGAGRRHDEAVLQRLCFLLPNVLWVFGGRDRIEWGDDPANAEMEYSGANLWPGLSAKVDPALEPRQHLLGNLSPDDCEQYLTDVIRDEAGTPLIPESVRSRIVSGSDGLPLYLDLAVNQFISASAGRQPVNPADYGGPLPSVVSRVLRDLTAEERRILRSACLFSRFDHDLASAASAAGSDAVVKRLLSRSYVDSSAPEPFGLSLPAALRDSIRAVDPQLDDGWSRREWSAAAARALDHLEGRWDAYTRGNDSGGADAALTQALETLTEVQEVPSWLYEASELAVERGQWRLLRAADRSVGQDGTARTAFSRGLAGIVERRAGSLPESIRLLRDAVADDGLLPGQISDLFRLHLANARRNLGEYQSVSDEYIRLSSSSSSSVRWHADYQLADLEYLFGDFTAALNRSDARAEASPREVERLRLHGHIHRYNADFRSATRSYREALEHADRCGGDGLRAKVETNLIETWQWTKPDQALEDIGAVIHRTERAKNGLDLCKLAAARVTLAGWAPDSADLDPLVASALGSIEASGYQAAEIFVRMGECFAAIRRDDPQRAQEAASRAAILTDRLGVYRFCATICGLWVGKDVASEWPRYQWLDEGARERWREVAHGRPVS